MAASDTIRSTVGGTTAPPVLIDLGKKSKKAVKRLRNGQGKLLEEINQAIRELREANKIGANAQPVVVVVREKPESLMDMMNW